MKRFYARLWLFLHGYCQHGYSRKSSFQPIAACRECNQAASSKRSRLDMFARAHSEKVKA